MLTIAISSLFATWLGITVIFQFMRPSPRWIRHQKLIPKYVIPQWTFFAPAPGKVDYRVVFQDYRTEDEPLGNVRELPLHNERVVTHALWNPEKRRRKAFLDIAQQLQQMRQMQDKSIQGVGLGIQMTTPYLAVLNAVMEPVPAHLDAKYRRFLIVFTAGFD